MDARRSLGRIFVMSDSFVLFSDDWSPRERMIIRTITRNVGNGLSSVTVEDIALRLVMSGDILTIASLKDEVRSMLKVY